MRQQICDISSLPFVIPMEYKILAKQEVITWLNENVGTARIEEPAIVGSLHACGDTTDGVESFDLASNVSCGANLRLASEKQEAICFTRGSSLNYRIQNNDTTGDEHESIPR